MQRRSFLRATGAATAGGFFLGFPTVKAFAEQQQADLVLVKNGDPAQLVRKALELMGGIERFVKPGQRVVIKPNMSWDRSPEYAANTNPQVAAEMVKLCLQAGADKVLAFDRTCQEARRCYTNSGVEKAMDDAGASVRFIRDSLFETVDINGFVLDKWEYYRDVLEADVYINLPVMKHHSLSRLSLGLKNTMGLIGRNRGKIHSNFDRKLADLNRVLTPDLTLVDATRILRANGPSGGNLGDVEQWDTVLAGTDPVLVDAWGVKLFGLEPMSLGWLRYSHEAGLGSLDTAAQQPLEFSFI